MAHSIYKAVYLKEDGVSKVKIIVNSPDANMYPELVFHNRVQAGLVYDFLIAFPNIITKAWEERGLTPKQQLSEVQALKELLLHSWMADDAQKISKPAWAILVCYLQLNSFRILDILDDALYQYLNPRNLSQ